MALLLAPTATTLAAESHSVTVTGPNGANRDRQIERATSRLGRFLENLAPETHSVACQVWLGSNPNQSPNDLLRIYQRKVARWGYARRVSSAAARIALNETCGADPSRIG